MRSKKEIRETMLKQRNEIDREWKHSYDQNICAELGLLANDMQVSTLHCYLPMGTEINIYPFIELMLQKGIRVVCPKSLPKGKMENRILHSTDQLEEGIFGTKHPAETILFNGPYDLIIVPGLAFNISGSRIGYGAGYYDIFLKDQSRGIKTGLAYPFQILPEIPDEAHDIKLDYILFK